MQKINQELNYSNFFTRSFASMIDIFIANSIRAIFLSIIGNIWLNNEISKFRNDFNQKYDTDFIGNDPEKIQFLVEHSVFSAILIALFLTFLVGAFYYIILQSKSGRTVGKKLMKIKLVKKDGSNLTFLESASYYFLGLLPWLFVIYIFIYQITNKVNIYNAITGNVFNLVFGFITLAWLQIHIITKKKTTASDIICNVVVIKQY